MAEETQAEKKTFQIDLFQVSRVHTERFTEQFETKQEALNYAEELCKDKGIRPDYEIQDVTPEPPVEDTGSAEEVTDVPADVTPTQE